MPRIGTDSPKKLNLKSAPKRSINGKINMPAPTAMMMRATWSCGFCRRASNPNTSVAIASA